jgi:hypothetical protein
MLLLLSLSRSNCRHIQLVSLLHTLLGMNTVQTCPVVTPSFWYRGVMYGELWGISLISCGIWGPINEYFYVCSVLIMSTTDCIISINRID